MGFTLEVLMGFITRMPVNKRFYFVLSSFKEKVYSEKIIFTTLFIFKIGKILIFNSNPVLDFHWLPKIKPIKVRKYRGQIQLVLLTYRKNNRYYYLNYTRYLWIHNYSVWIQVRNANVIDIYIQFEPCSLPKWITPAPSQRFYGVVAL